MKEVVSSNPGTRQISVILADPDKLIQHNDPQITGHVSVAPTCIKNNHLHYSEEPTFHNQKNVAIARCTSLWSSKQKYVPKRLQQRCCLHPPRCINCPVIRSHCDGVIPMPFNVNCNSNLIDGSHKILVLETSAVSHSSAGCKMASPKTELIHKQISPFPKQITATTLSSCFQKNTTLGSNSCYQDLSEGSEVSENTPNFSTLLQPNHAQKYLCYYPNSYNQRPYSKYQNVQQQCPVLKTKPLCVENKLQNPQESNAITHNAQSCKMAKNTQSCSPSDDLQRIHPQSAEEFQNLSSIGDNAHNVFLSGKLGSQENINCSSSDSNVGISHNIPNNMNLFASFQSSSTSDKPSENPAADKAKRQSNGMKPAVNSLEKFNDISPSNTGSTKNADISPKVNLSIPAETSARSNSSSDSRVSFEFSLEAERMVSSLCSSTPVKESNFSELEKTEQLSEPIAHFLTLICHSEQTNQNRLIGSKENEDSFNVKNNKYNTEYSSNLSTNNANTTQSRNTPKEALKPVSKEAKIPSLSQIPSINEETVRRDYRLPPESKYSKPFCTETFQVSREDIKRSFKECIREEETLFKKAALRGCYEISYILSESMSPGFDGIESFRKNVVEIISKADTIYGRRYILRDVVIGFLQLANCWANLYSCIGLPHDELKYNGDLHELFWNWTCASRKLMSGFNAFFEQQSSAYSKGKIEKHNSAQEERNDFYNHKHADVNKDRIGALITDSGIAFPNTSERHKQTYLTTPLEDRSSFYYPLNSGSIKSAATEIGASKASPFKHNQWGEPHTAHWGAKNFTRSSLETASCKTHGNMNKNKRHYHDNSKRNYYTHTPKYTYCQDRSTPTCAMSKAAEFHCFPSCASSLSADSIIKQEECCQSPISSSQQRGGGNTNVEIGFANAGNIWKQLQHQQFEYNDKESSNRYPYPSKDNCASTGNYAESEMATPRYMSQYNDVPSVLKSTNICTSSQMLQDVHNGNVPRSRNAEYTHIQKTASLNFNSMSHGDANEKHFIWKENRSCLNNKTHFHNANPYNSARNANVILPVLQDDPDSSEELEDRVYMKPGSYQVPKKQTQCANNTTAPFWNTKNNTLVSSQTQISISLPDIQNLQSQLPSTYNKSHFANSEDSQQKGANLSLKNMQNESKASPDLAWKAACESAETLLETLRGNATTSINTFNELSGLNHRENGNSTCMQKSDACGVQTLEHEETAHTEKREKQEKKDLQRNSTPTSDKRKNNVRTDDWLIHTLNNISKPQEEAQNSQDSERSSVTEKEKEDMMGATDVAHIQENAKFTQSSKHKEHIKGIHHAKQTASKVSSNKRAKEGKNADERPTPRIRKGVSGSSGRKSQTHYQTAERNSSSSRKRKLQEKSPKEDDSTNHNTKENSLRATNSGSNRKNKQDMRNKASWNVWYSSRRRRGLSQMAVDKLENILNTIWNMEESDFVKYTIDSNKARDYYKCVKHPMFLETIANKLKNHIYETIEHFVHDFRRVFFNAKLYNKEDTFHYKLVKILESKLNFLLDEHFSGWDLGYITGIPTEVANIPALRYLSYVGDGANTSRNRRSKVSNKAASSPRKAAALSTTQKQQT